MTPETPSTMGLESSRHGLAQANGRAEGLTRLTLPVKLSARRNPLLRPSFRAAGHCRRERSRESS